MHKWNNLFAKGKKLHKKKYTIKKKTTLKKEKNIQQPIAIIKNIKEKCKY